MSYDAMKWNGTPVNNVDIQWRNWYANRGHTRLCRKPTHHNLLSCTLASGHAGTCIAHYETSGTVAWVNDIYDPKLNVPEGL